MTARSLSPRRDCGIPREIATNRESFSSARVQRYGMSMRRPFVVGNWKMNLLSGTATALAQGLAKHVPTGDVVDVGVCPAFPYLQGVGAAIAGSGIQLGAQNCYFEKP